MCRFVLYLGTPIVLSSLITEPDHSIIHQSFGSREREEPLNGDGFGVAWFVPQLSSRPAVFKEISPAWSNANLLNLARVTRSACVLAHVRAATPGFPVANVNCHPFTFGPLAFMHNGSVGGFRRIVRKLRAELSNEAYELIRGTTDSEHVFALIWDEYSPNPEEEPLTRMATAIQGALRKLEQLQKEEGVEENSQYNLAISDGRCAVVSRYSSQPGKPANSLYLYTGDSYRCVDGEVLLAEAGEDTRAVIVASEPLSNETGWVKVEDDTLLLISPNLEIEQVRIERRSQVPS